MLSTRRIIEKIESEDDASGLEQSYVRHKMAIPTIDVTDASEHSSVSKSPSLIFTPEISSDAFHDAAARLHRTVSTVTAPEFPISDALSYMLEEVEKNDNVDAEDLLTKLQRKREDRRKKSSISIFAREFDSDLKKFLNTSPAVKRRATLSTVDDETVPAASNEGDEAEESKIQHIANYISAFDKVDLDVFSHIIGTATLKDNLELLADYFLDNVQNEWSTLFQIIVPVKQIHTMIVIGVVQFLSVNGILSKVPAVLTFASFFLCIYYTLQTLHNRQSLNDFVAWRKLLGIFAAENVEENVQECIENRRKKSVFFPLESDDIAVRQPFSKPYLKYFMFVVIFILGLSMSDLGRADAGIPSTDATRTIIKKAHSSNIFALFSLACLCTVLSTWTAFDVKNATLKIAAGFMILCLVVARLLPVHILRWFNGSFFYFRPVQNFGFQIDVFSICFLLSMGLYVYELCKKTACENYAKNWHQIIAPYVMCLIWWQITTTLFQAMNFSQLGKTDLVLTISMASLFLYPKIGLTAIIVTLIIGQSYNLIGFSGMLKFAVSIALLFLPVIGNKFVDRFLPKESRKDVGTGNKNISTSSVLRNRKNILLIFYLILVLGSALFLYEERFWIGILDHGNRPTSDFTWMDYKQNCEDKLDQKDLSTKPNLDRQIFCSDLRNLDVSWSGRLRSVEISRVDNIFHVIFAFLPDSLAEWMTCFYGQSQEGKMDSLTDQQNNVNGKLLTVRNCSLAQHNVYTFRLDIQPTEIDIDGLLSKGSKSDVIILIAGDMFKEAIYELNIDDTLSFGAKLYSDFSPKKPLTLKLTRLDRIMGQQNAKQIKKSLHAQHNDFWDRFSDSIYFLLSFIFSPIIRLSVS